MVRSAPWIFGATLREHELVHRMLNEMSDIMGCDERQGERAWITDTNIRWQVG